MSVDLKEFVPKTLNEAIEHLYANLDKKEIAFIQNNDNAMLHHTTGMNMRNSWGLWDMKSALNKDIRERFKLFGHGDDCSGLIMDGLWAKVKGEDVDKVLEATAERYRKHWTKYGLDPVTGKDIPGYKRPVVDYITIEIPKKPKKKKK